MDLRHIVFGMPAFFFLPPAGHRTHEMAGHGNLICVS